MRDLSASTVPPGFTETSISGPWTDAVGITFDSTGRMFVWERTGRIWIKDPSDTSFSLLLDINTEVGAWSDHGFLGFALDPNFRINGYIYLMYVVDRNYLLNFGTQGYDPNAHQYFAATIGRITRYTCTSSSGFRTVNLASRLILIGETKQTGFPICSDTHGVGSLVFGEDGTLLATCGDGASAQAADVGAPVNLSYGAQALSDGIIRTKESIGAYRSQLVDSLNGKLIRIDPATGNGIPSNPYYDSVNPRSPRSRVWALGLRNPFRMSLRPNTGSHLASDGNPGVAYIGNVGWNTYESLKVVTGPKQNFGWPIYEGLHLTPPFNGTYQVTVANLDAPNPLYPGSGCSQYFSFGDLLKEDTLNAAGQPPFVNPCNASQRIPSSMPQFLHTRPVLEWNHATATTLTPIYDGSGQAQTIAVGAVGSPVSGSQFAGNCAIGGTWYTGTAYPTQYQNTYFFADWGQGLIKNMTFDQNDKPLSVNGFASGTGPLVCMAQHPTDGSLYYISYDYNTATVKQLAYTGNRSPVAVASTDKYYGPSPLTVQLNSSGSSDPDGQSIRFSWDFGDGTPVSTLANPLHIFSAPPGVPTKFVVILTVTASSGVSAQATLIVVANDTPPNVMITSPVNGSLYSLSGATNINLVATVTDAESPNSQLVYQWQTLLHHNDHNHASPADTNHVTTTVISPIGCDGLNIYYYRIILTVTDPQGLFTVQEVRLFPNCGSSNIPPSMSAIPNQTTTIGVPVGPVPFVISDPQVAAANLQLSASSSNPALVPVASIVFGGSGSNRTVTVTPADSLNGTATITVSVNDGPSTVSNSFLVTVNGVDTAPTISSIANQSTQEGTAVGPISFTVGDAQSPAGHLQLSAVSSNPTLVSPDNIIFGGALSTRTLTVVPTPGSTGSSTITVIVSDGLLTASNSFGLTVSSLPSGAKTYTNAAAITIVDISPATPYPSTNIVSGQGGVISSVTVGLNGFNHTWASDVNVLLVAPGGQTVRVLEHAGSGPTANANFIFSDGAAGTLPKTGALPSGTYKPTTYTPAALYPSPAPAPPFGTVLSAFNGSSANGKWLLYVVDDGPGDSGNITGGWTLTIVTTKLQPSISGIPDQWTPVSTPTAAIPFTIGDPTTAASNLTVSAASSNPMLMPTNNIVFGGSNSNRTVTLTPAAGQSGTSTITVTVSDGQFAASTNFMLSVSNLFVGTQSFTKATAITIPLQGAATPYPSTINVSGMGGTISTVTVGLNGFSHTWASDVDVLLVSPAGQTLRLLENAGTGPTANANFTFSDGAGAKLPQTGALPSGTYKPTTYAPATTYPAPAPAAPYGTNLAKFNGQAPGGTWSLYALDDGPGDQGSISGGWSLTITTTSTIKQTPVITWGNPAAITYGTALSGAQLNATANVPGTFVYNPAAGTILNASNSQVLSVTFTPTDTSNYTTATGTALINVQKAPLTITAANKNKVYGAVLPALMATYTGFVNGDTAASLTTPVSLGTAVTTASPVGTYAITASGATSANYTITFVSGTLTVTPAPLTITAANKNKVYGAVLPALTATYTGFVNGDTAASLTAPVSLGTAATPASAVGTYPITASGATSGNYTITFVSGTLTVTLAPLTITADSKTNIYGAALPALTATYNGFVNGDTAASLTAPVSLGTAATPASAVGTYPITASGATSGNYTITFVSGTLTVTLAPLTITADSKTNIYGAALPALTATYTGFVNGDTAASLTTPVSLGTAATAASPVGTYPITASGATSTNYTITFVSGTLTVTLVPLTITADSQTNIYGAALPALTATYTGFVNGDTTNNLQTPVNLQTTATAASPVGNYPITANGATSTTYTITFVPGTLTVTQASLTITAEDKTRFVGQANPPLTATYNGFVNGDTVSNLSAALNLTTPATPGSPAGEYMIQAGAAADTNYTILLVNGTLTVSNQDPPQIISIVVDAQGMVSVTVSGDAGLNYALEASPDLLNWAQVDMQTNTTGSVLFTDQPTNSTQFYRAKSMP